MHNRDNLNLDRSQFGVLRTTGQQATLYQQHLPGLPFATHGVLRLRYNVSNLPGEACVASLDTRKCQMRAKRACFLLLPKWRQRLLQSSLQLQKLFGFAADTGPEYSGLVAVGETASVGKGKPKAGAIITRGAHGGDNVIYLACRHVPQELQCEVHLIRSHPARGFACSFRHEVTQMILQRLQFIHTRPGERNGDEGAYLLVM